MASAGLLAPAVPSVRPVSFPVTVSTGVSAAEWDGYVEGHPEGTADHLWHWREVFGPVFGQRCEYLAARRDGTLVGVLPLVLFRSLLFGRFAVSVPYLNYGGLLTSDADAEASLLEHAAGTAREFGASHLELRHQRRHSAELPCRTHKVRMLLELPPTVDELWTRTDRKVRNQVRKARKEGLVGTSGQPARVEDFYPVFARNMRDLGTPVYPLRFFRETLRVFSNRACIHLVRAGSRVVAASITVRFRDTVIVPWASSLREYRHLCPNMLLYWSMLESAIAGRAATFDFGRSTKGSGPHHFKEQWGASGADLHWEYVLLTRADAPDQGPGNAKMARAIAAWQRLPLPVANQLGPWIVRHIP